METVSCAVAREGAAAEAAGALFVAATAGLSTAAAAPELEMAETMVEILLFCLSPPQTRSSSNTEFSPAFPSTFVSISGFRFILDH